MPYVNPVPEETAREWAQRRANETGQAYFLTSGGKAFYDCEVNRETVKYEYNEQVTEVVTPNNRKD